MNRPAGQGARVHAHTLIRARTAPTGKTSSRGQISVKERAKNPHAAPVSLAPIPIACPCTRLPLCQRRQPAPEPARAGQGKVGEKQITVPLCPNPHADQRRKHRAIPAPPNLHALPASAQKHATILAVSFLATAAAGLRLLGCRRSVGACCVAVFPIFFSESLLCLC